MNKPYIVCHVMASVDGRIDCAMTEKIETGNEYDEALELLEVPTTLCGRVTAAMHYAGPGVFQADDLRPVGKVAVNKATETEGYSVMLDTKGTLLWESNWADGKPLLCLVSEQASRAYLDYLEKKEISYIAVGKETIDLPRAMAILFDTFKVKRLGIVGGGKTNGSFLKAGLIDEVSLMLTPGIDGRSNQPAVFDGLPDDAEPVKLKMTAFQTYGCGLVWIRYHIKK